MIAALAAILASACSCAIPAAPVDDCPKGADYLRTFDEVRGACAVAFDGARLLACAPESVGDGTDAQLVAFALDGSLRELSRTGVASAADIDVASDGTIALADAAGGIVVFGPDRSRRTLAVEHLESASGVAWMGANLAVSDPRAGVVVIVSPDGRALARLGAGVLRDPQGLDAASDGSLYIADRLAECIWHISPSADGAWTSPPVRLGERGSNPGQFRAPSDVAVREQGGSRCIVVADEQNHRIQVLDAEGRFVGFFGMHALIPRQGEGRIHYPRAVALSADGGTLAVAEGFEDRIQLFRLKPEADAVDASANRVEFITSHFGAKAACDEDLLVLLDVETQGVALLDARTTPPIHMSIIGGAGALAQRFGEVSAIGVEPGTARVWVADRARARIDVFDTVWDRTKPPGIDMFIPRLARSMDLVQLAARWKREPAAGALATPEIADIAFTRGGDARLEVLLLDTANRAVLRTDARLAGVEVLPLPTGASMPTELAVHADGSLAVADPAARRVYLRRGNGEWTTLDRLGSIGFGRPSGVGFQSDGSLVVSDAALDACIVGVADGTARLVGERGILDEQFFDPQAIAPSPKGLIVVDRGNHRFQRFGDGFVWNLTGSMGRYYDQKRQGSPGAAPASTPETRTKQGGES